MSKPAEAEKDLASLIQEQAPRVRIDPRSAERRKRYVKDRREGRISLRGMQKLKVHDYGGQLRGHHSTWVNDYPGEVQKYLDMGYSPVYKDGNIKVGDLSDDFACRLETWVSAVVGKLEDNSPQRAYLMKIPEEWYKEDEAEKTRLRIEKEKQIYGENFEKNPNFALNKGEHGEQYINRQKGIYMRTDLTKRWQEDTL